MNRVVHFEIQAEDPERAIKFYADALGWSIKKYDPPVQGDAVGKEGPMEYWMIMTAEEGSKEMGINGGLLRRPAKTPPDQHGTNAYVCTMQVESYDEIHDKILKAGGRVALPKFAIAGMAWQGYYLDTEGNTFGIHQPDENAK